MRWFAALLICLPFGLAAGEVEENRRVCTQLGGETEVRTSFGTRVDCLTDTVAYEADWSNKWAEAIGQALHYAAATDREPGIIFLCREEELTCLRHFARLSYTLNSYDWPTRWHIEIVEVGR